MVIVYHCNWSLLTRKKYSSNSKRSSSDQPEALEKCSSLRTANKCRPLIMSSKVWVTIKLKTFLSWNFPWAFWCQFVWSKKSFCLMVFPPLTLPWKVHTELGRFVPPVSPGLPWLRWAPVLPLNENFSGLRVIPKPKESNCWNHSIPELLPVLQKTLSALAVLYHILWMSAQTLNSSIVWDGKHCFPIHVHLKL